MKCLEVRELTNEEVKLQYPTTYELYKTLPQTLPKKEILMANSKKHDISMERTYSFDNMQFVIPANVFEPGGTSENIFKKIQQESINIEGKVVAIMGCGAGVEVVLAGLKEPNIIYAFDIDAESIKATRTNFNRYVENPKLLKEFTSDLFNELTQYIKFDLVLFNPPAVSIPISDNLNVIRNTSVGTEIVTSFFKEISEKDLLDENGEIIITLSNTSELRKIISYTLTLGFKTEILEMIEYSKPYEKIKTFIFKLTYIQT